jgi:hypothetical protein
MFNTNGTPTSPRTIVRDGLTRRERLAIAERDPRAMAALDGFDAATRHQICALCDDFKRKINRKHGKGR